MDKDLISRKWLMSCVEEGWIKFDTEKDENRFIHLVRDIAPSAQPEHLQTVMEKIKEKYEKGMNTPCINNPMAWALYETWKEYDR